MHQRKLKIRELFDRLAPDIDRWRRRSHYFHANEIAYLRYVVGGGKRVLVLGSGTGDLLNALEPAQGLGIDLSERCVEIARAKYPQLRFEVGDADRLELPDDERFDYIILSDLVGYLEDVQASLAGLRRYCLPETRIVICYYNVLWQPLLRLGEKLGLKMPTPPQSWLSLDDLGNLLWLGDMQVIKTERRMLFPKYLPLLSWLLNHLGNLPGFGLGCLSHYVIARPAEPAAARQASVSVVIPCRNERGNIEPAIARMPQFGSAQEIIFIDGRSSDGTRDEIRRVAALHPGRNIRLLEQQGTGKGDAVRQAFAAASGDILMILDADLTVPPEDLPRFHQAIASGKGEFISGCRLVYPMEDEAMQTLNLIANKSFALGFSWLLGQRLKDTLCGTKVLWRRDYEAIARNRSYFGDIDPFGDFDLLFGASKLNLKIAEIPVRYQSRSYGQTKISRFRHGWMLLRMAAYGYRKLKGV
jgi:SAM-dependent methyltransferase